MSSLYPSLLSGQPGLSIPPPLTDTIHVTSSYTVAAGDSLDFAGSPGFKLEIRHDASVTLDIDGAVNLDGGKHLKVTGILTSRSIHGDAQVAIGATGSLTVATEAVGGLAIGALMQSAGSSFVNEGLVHVSSVNGAATGVSGAVMENITVANTNTIQVEAATTAFGVAVVTSGAVSNSGSISVAGARALGMALTSGLSHTATMLNTGRIEAVGSADSGWAYGAELVGGDFTNTGRIHAASAGDAFGAHVSDLDSLTNTGHITAASTGVGGHSIGLLVDTTFNGGTITNTGLVRGEYALTGDDAGRQILGGVGVASNDVVINTGKLVGDVALGGGSDGLSNTGRIVGDVDLGDGGDILISNRGHLAGAVMGGLGADYIEASRGDDTIYGDEQDDGLGGGDDALRGMKGADLLFGGQGVDTLLGGLGADTLSGGAGDDVFTLAKLADSTAAAPDLITDLASTETIDLQRIDADTTVGGDQAFHLVASFSGAAGELTVAYDGGSGLTTISGDVDGDGSADLVITAAGDHSGFAGFVL